MTNLILIILDMLNFLQNITHSDIINVAQLVKDLSKNIYDEEVRAEFESEVS